MFQHRELGLSQIYQILTTLLLTVLYWVYYYILEYAVKGFSLTDVGNYLDYFLVIMLGIQFSFMGRRRQDFFSITSGIVESHRVVWPHLVFAVAITCIFLVMKKDEEVSRLFLFSFMPLAYVVLVIFTRYFAFEWMHMLQKRNPEKLLIIGKPEEARKVESLLIKARFFGIDPVGILTHADASELPEGIQKIGTPDDFAEWLGKKVADNILILGSPSDRRKLGDWLRLAETHGCRVTMVNDLDVFLQRPLCYFRCDDVDLIELRDEPLLNPVNRLVKRGLDLAVAIPVVLFALPVLAGVVWMLQRKQAPGPLLFRQLRSGIQNQPFTILKFRTMYADSCGSAEQAKQGDGRVFPAGRCLRRCSLDEFPQFVNVLTGKMSLVGPRPHMIEHDVVFAEKMSSYPVRGFVKPGVTGLAQIRGYRGETAAPQDIVRRVECDLEYIESWSFLLDIRILWQTLIQAIRPPKSAY